MINTVPEVILEKTRCQRGPRIHKSSQWERSKDGITPTVVLFQTSVLKNGETSDGKTVSIV